jgi:hypothetical protein
MTIACLMIGEKWEQQKMKMTESPLGFQQLKLKSATLVV